jgi:ATP-binding cassette subfamily B protein
MILGPKIRLFSIFKLRKYTAFWRLLNLANGEGGLLIVTSIIVIANVITTLLAPLLFRNIIDGYIKLKKIDGFYAYCGLLICIYLVAAVLGYLQARIASGIAQRILFNLRKQLFEKLQQLPTVFFTSNKSADIISRINKDTDRLNTFFSQFLIQFCSGVLLTMGAAVFLLVIRPQLGLIVLIPALIIVLSAWLFSPYLKNKNLEALTITAKMNSEIHDNFTNFKVFITSSLQNYFQQKFSKLNKENFNSSRKASFIAGVFYPLFDLFGGLAQLIVLFYGIYLIRYGLFTIGSLVGYLAYLNFFYGPLKDLSLSWTTLQGAFAAWERILAVLSEDTNLTVSTISEKNNSDFLMEFENVNFCFQPGISILQEVNLKIERGRKYAIIGPTGGGKTTIASLMARLFDPSDGKITFNGLDIKSYPHAERCRQIGFILQDPVIFTGTIRENLLYGNQLNKDCSDEELSALIKDLALEELISAFKIDIKSEILSPDQLSIGQKQILAFMRAILRRPELLILDEASANVDMRTEKLFNRVLEQISDITTPVVIAHSMATVENADQIIFVHSGTALIIDSFDEISHTFNLVKGTSIS